MKKLRQQGEIRACREVGPTGYCLYWQLMQLGVDCELIAPSLIPVKASERIQTDRRDAEKLARCCRAGELTAFGCTQSRAGSFAVSGASARSG
ncbi:MAG: hypothetical protein K7J46_11220 [Bryobacter sp.]|nr:hypothetical protein [Bryobacter sp. CoA8 C33]